MIISPKVLPIWFRSQKVLPLVYDDSLSYYEVLCKFRDKLNEVIGVINGSLVEILEPIVSEIISKFFATTVYHESIKEIEFKIEEEE